ncbi:uncharacterized protein LOC106174310 [Lingula anatina]|uniref:Uncharacterized protein LOC106174310 n=1 Tax=Lingula anatina TaxID=7574 RepID=A0A1S3JLL0_LINAN|nr:uncharacterized protein LOC106174310 [Lingula anatina]|eukprot:XP_013411268.1 uncharacterized protein LOC106174310 [Lingula anatina]
MDQQRQFGRQSENNSGSVPGGEGWCMGVTIQDNKWAYAMVLLILTLLWQSFQGANGLPSLPLIEFRSEQEAIEAYFSQGFQYKAIVIFLGLYHGIHLSLRTLKRRIRSYGLSRRGFASQSPLHFVYQAIRRELEGTGRLGGYRSMWQRLIRKYHLRVTQEMVRLLLRQIDPISVENRRLSRLQRRTYISQGPNHCWHVDGYDKLKIYGFEINGCIDGFSRRIMWLECNHTNHKSSIICKYFLDTVRQMGMICPKIVRTDCGTENSLLAPVQCSLTNSSHGHRYGTSPSNQRIEQWWSFLRRNRSTYWINLFEDLTEEGHFTVGNSLQIECLRFCFMDLLRKDLQEAAVFWNTHRIRPSRYASCPAGIPDELYFLPPNGRDCKVDVSHQDWDMFYNFTEANSVCQDGELEEFLQFLMETYNLIYPENVDDALELYLRLKALTCD